MKLAIIALAVTGLAQLARAESCDDAKHPIIILPGEDWNWWAPVIVPEPS
jgi:hypothetical protein